MPVAQPNHEKASLHDEVLRRVLDATNAELTLDQLNAETSLRDDLDMTSLESLSLVIELEEHFGVDVEDDELTDLVTVGDVLALIEAKQAAA